MSKAIDKPSIFDALKPVLVPYSNRLVVIEDSDSNFYLDTHHIMKNKKSLFFGAVQVKKNYISFHLMPVYVKPPLLDPVSDALKKRMQGKSCFNFKSIEADLIEELAVLTESGYQFYVSEGYIQPEL